MSGCDLDGVAHLLVVLIWTVSPVLAVLAMCRLAESQLTWLSSRSRSSAKSELTQH